MQLEIFKKWDTPRDLYSKKEYQKKQICLHHTVSGEGYSGDVATMFKRGYVVAYMIERNGNIHQLRGHWRDLTFGGLVVPALASLHPSELMKAPRAKPQAWADLLSLAGRMGMI